MTVERYGSKTDVVVKLVLVFFIALLSFSVGTFVGKKFSDNQHKMAQLEPGDGSNGDSAHSPSGDAHGTEGEEARGIASVHPDAGNVKPEKALTDDEIAKLAEEFVTDDSKTAEPGKMNDKHMNENTQAKADAHGDTGHGTAPAAAHGTPAPTGHAPASVTPAAQGTSPTKAPAQAVPAADAGHSPSAQTEVLKPATRMAEGHSPVIENPPVQASRIPAALPKEVASSAIGKYTVQVASYSTEKEAQNMSADLKTKGFSAFYVSAKIKGKTWYRVSVGLFTTTKEAEAYKKDLLTRAKVASALVTKISSAD